MATMGEKDERLSLQRRGGRRISIPSSPISFTLSKRNDKQVRSPDGPLSADAFSSIDTPSDRPSIDLNFPSPLLGTSLFSPVSATDSGRNVNHLHNAASEDTERSKLLGSWDNPQGPSLTGRGLEVRQSQLPRPNHLSEMSSRSSPIIPGYRDRNDHGRSVEGKDRNFDAPPLASRNYSTTSLSTDKSASDENVAVKAQTSKKSRLNLLNPMSLLARRRSSQNTKIEDMKVSISPLQVPAIPENFDPCIRGNFVHDFSTPRTRRAPFDNSPRRETFSSPATFPRVSESGTPGPQHGNSQSSASHSPMFREHFQEDENTIQPSHTAYLHGAAASHQKFDAPSPHSLPSFAQKLPAVLPDPGKLTEEDANVSKLSQIPHPESSPPPPPISPKRTPSPHLDLPPVAALPKHMTSVSSRFSFQIAGQGSSAQEKLLEEKHKEHFGTLPDSKSKPADDADDDYDENYDFDADVDGYEEEIPGVNAGLDDSDGFDNDDVPIRNIEISSSQQEPVIANDLLQAFHFTPPGMAFSPSSTHHTSEPTPRDDQGFPIGMADTKNSPAQYGPDSSVGNTPSLFLEGLRISTVEDIPDEQQESNQVITESAFDDSELYFDDGEFDMGHDAANDQFDESLLDDESGQIRDIPAENARKYEKALLQKTRPGDRIVALDPSESGISRDTSSSSNFLHLRGGDDDGFFADRDLEFDHTRSSKTSVLTEDNLAAYHDALVEAANYAAANGKFNRQVSFNSAHSDDAASADVYQNRPSLALNDLQYSENTPDSELMDDHDISGFDVDDDDLDDDLMIAEANAEALENDDEGFYGQEFGFYARAHSKDTSELVNGGYFTARGSNGVKRSHSGKAVFQEPSLTPITERSEWSTRNSVVSFSLHNGFSGAAPALTSPGIDQLIDSPSFEDEMSLSALMKLRRGAFGGSSTSINSLGERSAPGSSPLAHGSKHLFPSSDNHLGANGAKYAMASSISIMESEDEDAADTEQLTLTQNTPQKKKAGESPPVSATPQHQQQPSVHLAVTESPRTSRKVQHHRRSSSGADSVSYVRDTDGQWVLERRRTGDDGEQEVVEREYLAGARI